jgi:hypothetical protein
MKWEYRVIFGHYPAVEQRLNDLGKEGWELFSTSTHVEPMAGGAAGGMAIMVCTLKRQLTDS